MLDSEYNQIRYHRLLGLLAPQHRRFVEEYLKDFNGAAAAVRAGYSPQSARQQSRRLLGRLRVKEAVDAGMLAQDKWADDLAGMLRSRLESMARVDFADLFDERGNPLPYEKWPAGAAHTIQSITFLSGPDKKNAGAVLKLRRVDHVKVLCLLLDILKAAETNQPSPEQSSAAGNLEYDYRFWDYVVPMLLDHGFKLTSPTGEEVDRSTAEDERDALLKNRVTRWVRQ